MNATDRRAKARERKREQRRRERKGIGLYRLQFDRDEIESALVDAGAIDPSVADIPNAQAKALARIIRRALGLEA